MGKPYPSMPTRFFTLDCLLGDGKINETVPGLEWTPYDVKENLRDKFRSNLPWQDLPRANGVNFTRRPILGIGRGNFRKK